MAVALSILRCGDDAVGDRTGSKNEPSPSVERPPQQVDHILAVAVSAGTETTLIAAGADGLFYEWLADGSFSFTEYEAAVLEYVQCMTASAFRAQPGYPRLTPWAVYQVQFADIAPAELEAKGLTQADLQTVIRTCGQQFWQPASRLWHPAHVPSVSYEQDAREVLAACLRSSAIEIPEDPSEDEFRRLFDESIDARRDLGAWSTCLRQVEDEYFITGTGIE
jgi:hypothetical protein